MKSVQELLEDTAAGTNTIEEDDWPRVRKEILERLETICDSEFPPPPPSPEDQSPEPSQSQAQEGFPSSPILKNNSSLLTSSGDKENAPPPIADSRFAHPSALELVATTKSSIRSILTEEFPTTPPYTIQRLTELILQPKQHYRFLPPYLQALLRVVSVSSTASVFPLTHQAIASTSIINGMLETTLGSDESLGGALLSPIPWLTNTTPSPTAVDSPHSPIHSLIGSNADVQLQSESTEMIEGPNGTGTIETVSVVGSNTSTSATVSPSSQHLHAITGGDSPESAALTSDDEMPHARGPDEIGVEDTGPDTGIGGVAGILASSGKEAEKTEEGDSEMDVDTDSK